MSDVKPKDVDTYISSSVEEARPIMNELRDIIRSVIPDAEEGISWNVPVYKYHGILAGFDAAKSHVSFGVDVLQSEDREALEAEGYKTGSKTIQIKFDQKVPAAMIKKLLKAQAEMNKAGVNK